MSSHSLVQKLPKIELHRHIEGCIDPNFLRQHLDKFIPDHNLIQNGNIEQLFNYQNFLDFLRSWSQIMDLLSEIDQFRDLARYVVTQLKKEGIVYTELIFSPQPFVSGGLDTEQLLTVMYEEFNRGGIKTKLIIDFVRNFGKDAMVAFLPELIRIKQENDELGNWLRAVSIGGDELNYPANNFITPFKQANEAGFHLYAHAGEWDGVHSIWDSINYLDVERIGHGIHCMDDPALIKYLKYHQIGLDISITSNIQTGAVNEDTEHPVKSIYQQDCPITINTDDPGFFHTNLIQEYQRFLDLGFGLDDLKKVVENALVLSFLSKEEQEAIRRLL